ncbi:5623_t:CDS:2 [Ambispora leptoticha]|uniref:5623_t:CDS:1 n=1 Tax=Ambispora leptoticha TaxID=144679 RepID=A0A9N8Z9W5_9GLOM|nr:5623_t:CDS:2 [Ambispora leptoticha]
MAKTKITQKLSSNYGSEKRISVISKSASVNNGDLDRENLSKMKAQTEAAADVFEQAATDWKKANKEILTLQTMMSNGNPIFKKRIPILSESESSDFDEIVDENDETFSTPSKSKNRVNEKNKGKITSFDEMKFFSPSNYDMNQKRIRVDNLYKKSKKPKFSDVKTVKQTVEKSDPEKLESLPELKSKKVPKNSYLYFVSQRFADVKAEFPNLQMTDINGKIAEMWKNLPAKEKESFQAEFHAQQQKYGNGRTHMSSPESSKLISTPLKPSSDSSNFFNRESSMSTFDSVTSQNDEVPWILPIVGTPTSFGLSPYRKRKIRKSSFSDDY